MKDLLKDLLKGLSEAPDSQIDKSITKVLKTLVGKDESVIKPKLLECIDACQVFSLASAFSIITMKTIYESLLDGDPEDYGARIINTPIK